MVVKSIIGSRTLKVGLAALLAVPLVSGTALAETSESIGLQLNKTASTSTPTVGKQFTFTITDTNNTGGKVRDLNIFDNLPSGLTLVNARATDPNNSNVTCSTQGNNVTCGSFTLSQGDTATVTITAKPTQKGKIRNTATDSSGDSASTTVTVKNKKHKHKHQHHG